MFDLAALSNALTLLSDPNIFFAIIIGLVFGILVGAIPGLSSSMALIMLFPITYGLDPLVAVVLLASTFGGTIFGGSITAIILHTPGHPGSAATAIEGFALTQKGKSNTALGISSISSAVGGVISYVLLFFLIFQIARFTLMFSSPEIFAVTIFGVTVIGVLRGSNMAKGLASGFFGLLISLMGIAPYGQTRATFGIPALIDGVETIAVLIGLLAFPQILIMIEEKFIVKDISAFKPSYKPMIVASLLVLKTKNWFNIIRSSLIGLIIGLVPAAGATVAAFVSYNEAARYSKEEFGKGSEEGLIAAETANNASEGGSLATMLALGIPGSPASAVIMGALLVHGVRPGPRLFLDAPEVILTGMTFVYAIIITQIVAAILIYPIGLGYSKWLSGILKYETKYLSPVIAILCVVGAIALRNMIFDAGVMLIFGVLGFIMIKYGYPPIAMVLGVILGSVADTELARIFMMFENVLEIFTRPITVVFFSLALLSIAYPFIAGHIEKKRKDPATQKNGD